jgi:hypothetical protein
MNNNLQHAVGINSILSPWHQEILSDKAQKVFIAIWHRMRNSGRAEVWLDDETLSIRARVLLPYVAAARTELLNVGLLTALKGSRGEWKYVYANQPDYDSDEAEAGR